jgi:pimeloyl-ACP methyl ester carboxylesterase
MRPQVLEHEITGDGPETLVLLPGGLTGWQSWRPLVAPLAVEHRVVNLQLLSNAEGIAGRHGNSTYTADLERENVLLTLDAARVRGPVHLLGWSNGGRVALDLAINCPNVVRSVTAIEPAAWWLLGEREDANNFETFILRVSGRDLTDEDVMEFLWRAGLGPRGTDFQAMPAWPVWQQCRNALSWFSSKTLETAKAGIDNLESLTMPLLCVRGSETSPWLYDVVEVVAARVAHTTVLELPGGHACLLQNPDAFVTAVARHVRAASAIPDGTL